VNHCIHCGYTLPDTEGWPRQCEGCRRFNYNSPKPVVVVHAHARGKHGIGPVIIQRGIEPYKDEWAFPGGYLDHAEDWRQAAVREFREEVGVTLDIRFLRLVRVVTTKTNFCVLFVHYDGDVLRSEDWQKHDLTKTTNDRGVQEVVKISVATPDTVLGVPSHQEFREWQRSGAATP